MITDSDKKPVEKKKSECAQTKRTKTLRELVRFHRDIWQILMSAYADTL